MKVAKSPKEIAQEYITAWEDAWNNEGVEATVKLYALDSVLVGYVTAIGQSEIADLLGGIFAQGWTKIKIKVTNAREVNGVILIANEYSAFGSGPNEGKTLSAKSSHVLVPIADSYVSVLHTAT
jgi:ketosteroid isomerase-like protein